jgi:hypothetical protein
MGMPGLPGTPGAPGPQGPAGSPGINGEPDSGCPSARIDGTCLLSFNNSQTTNFFLAATTCANQGGDLCTESQLWPISVGYWQNIYLAKTVMQNAHWSASFADNDANQWYGANGNTGDDHSANSSYGYACCGGTTPINPRLTPQSINNVEVLAVHNAADTYFSGAVGYCAAVGGDICSESQTLLLRNAGALTVPAWTNAASDNDAGLYNAINGGTADNPHPSNVYGFACCASTLPLDLSCPVPRTGGVCAVSIHNTADTNFTGAATACAQIGADLCSTSQSAVLRGQGALSVPAWTNSHSDNDGGNASVGVGALPDNPVLSTNYGYACCLK